MQTALGVCMLLLPSQRFLQKNLKDSRRNRVLPVQHCSLVFCFCRSRPFPGKTKLGCVAYKTLLMDQPGPAGHGIQGRSNRNRYPSRE